MPDEQKQQHEREQLQAALNTLPPRIRDVGLRLASGRPLDAAQTVLELLEGGYDLSPGPRTYLINYDPQDIADPNANTIASGKFTFRTDEQHPRDMADAIERIKKFSQAQNIDAPHNAAGNPANTALLFKFYQDIYESIDEDGPRRYRVKLTGGGSISVRPDRISYSGIALDNHEAHRATMLLIKNTWGGGTATGGDKEFQLTLVAYGKAYGADIKAADQASFTKDDWASIERRVAEIQARDRRPSSPQASFRQGNPAPLIPSHR